MASPLHSRTPSRTPSPDVLSLSLSPPLTATSSADPPPFAPHSPPYVPAALPPTAAWDPAPPPADDLLPSYTRKDPERVRRESISTALWDEQRQREADLARALQLDRLERQRTREERERQHAHHRWMGSWIRWSAKFYMPMMSKQSYRRA